jgi:hypothetical protein
MLKLVAEGEVVSREAAWIAVVRCHDQAITGRIGGDAANANGKCDSELRPDGRVVEEDDGAGWHRRHQLATAVKGRDRTAPGRPDLKLLQGLLGGEVPGDGTAVRITAREPPA